MVRIERDAANSKFRHENKLLTVQGRFYWTVSGKLKKIVLTRFSLDIEDYRYVQLASRRTKVYLFVYVSVLFYF